MSKHPSHFFFLCLKTPDGGKVFVVSDSAVCALKSIMWVGYLNNKNPSLIDLPWETYLCLYVINLALLTARWLCFWWIVQQLFDWLLLVLSSGNVTMSIFSKYKCWSCPGESAERKPNRCSAKPSALTDFPAVVYLYKSDSRTASAHLPPVCLSDPRSYQMKLKCWTGSRTDIHTPLSPDKRYRHFRLVLTVFNTLKHVKCFYPNRKCLWVCSWQKACIGGYNWLQALSIEFLPAFLNNSLSL